MTCSWRTRTQTNREGHRPSPCGSGFRALSLYPGVALLGPQKTELGLQERSDWAGCHGKFLAATPREPTDNLIGTAAANLDFSLCGVPEGGQQPSPRSTPLPVAAPDTGPSRPWGLLPWKQVPGERLGEQYWKTVLEHGARTWGCPAHRDLVSQGPGAAKCVV